MHRSVEFSEFIRVHTVHEVRLRSLAFSLVPNWADAEEVLQEANLIIWQKFDQFQPGTNFIAWSSQILRLTAKDFRARQLRAKVLFTDQFYDMVAEDMTLASEELAERERILHECIRKLKERQQNILQLRYFQSKTVSGVAEAIGSTAKAVYHALEHIHRSLLQCVNAKLQETNSK
jgi:RNA polymerase sigma-70 factor (ECF subfamily)